MLYTKKLKNEMAAGFEPALFRLIIFDSLFRIKQSILFAYFLTHARAAQERQGKFSLSLEPPLLPNLGNLPFHSKYRSMCSFKQPICFGCSL